MKKNPKSKHLTLKVAATLLVAIVLGGCLATIQLPADARAACAATVADINSWFESGTASKDGVVKPADGLAFGNHPNCDFHNWSQQMFLWLTSPTPQRYGGGGGRIFNSAAFYDVSPLSGGKRDFIQHQSNIINKMNLRTAPVGPHKLPLAVESKSERIFEILPPDIGKDGHPLVLNAQGAKVEVARAIKTDGNTPIFFDLSGKPIERPRPIIPPSFKSDLIVQQFNFEGITFFLDPLGNIVDVETGQAGGFQVLMAKGGSLVYYQIAVNDVYAYFRTAVDKGVITANEFPTTQAAIDDIKAFATANGKTLIDPDEALAVEVKTSWVELSTIPGPDRGKFITTKATVPLYDTSNPNDWAPIGQKTVKLAMVGMHVVGSVAQHPEMIWATFEHLSTAPNGSYNYFNTSNVNTNMPQTPITDDWVLCADGSTGPFNEPHLRFDNTTQHLVNISPFTISPSDILRLKPWGKTNPTTSAAVSNTEVISSDNAVRNVLDNNDVRKNYYMTGSTWLIPGSSTQVGTNNLQNASMETFQQISSTGGISCLSCHSGSDVNVSAIWGDMNPLF